MKEKANWPLISRLLPLLKTASSIKAWGNDSTVYPNKHYICHAQHLPHLLSTLTQNPDVTIANLTFSFAATGSLAANKTVAFIPE